MLYNHCFLRQCTYFTIFLLFCQEVFSIFFELFSLFFSITTHRYFIHNPPQNVAYYEKRNEAFLC